MRNSFVLYTEYADMLEYLTADQAGELFKALFRHAKGEDVENLEPIVALAFSSISKQMDRDADKYEEKCNQRKEAGKKSAERRANEPQRKATTVESRSTNFNETPTNSNELQRNTNERQRKATDNEDVYVDDNEDDDVNVDVNVNDNEDDINLTVDDKKTHRSGLPDPCGEIITYLNDRTGAHYKADTPKTKTLIKHRMQEGFDVGDFMLVIDKMADEWQNDPKMSKYLRPETLFGTKFEGYLNRQRRNKYDVIDEWMI